MTKVVLRRIFHFIGARLNYSFVSICNQRSWLFESEATAANLVLRDCDPFGQALVLPSGQALGTSLHCSGDKSMAVVVGM